MGLSGIMGNVAMLAYVGAAYALMILPVSIPLIVIIWRAWDRVAPVLPSGRIGTISRLFLPTVGIFATLLAVAPSVCEEGICSPRYDVLRLSVGAILVVALMAHVYRRNALRSSREGRRLLRAALAAQGYYAVVVSWIAYWTMQIAGPLGP